MTKKYKPDGYMVVHYGSNFTADFGPFTFKQAERFVKKNKLGQIVPLFKTVDWDRDSELRHNRAEIDL